MTNVARTHIHMRIVVKGTLWVVFVLFCFGGVAGLVSTLDNELGLEIADLGLQLGHRRTLFRESFGSGLDLRAAALLVHSRVSMGKASA